VKVKGTVKGAEKKWAMPVTGDFCPDTERLRNFEKSAPEKNFFVQPGKEINDSMTGKKLRKTGDAIASRHNAKQNKQIARWKTGDVSWKIDDERRKNGIVGRRRGIAGCKNDNARWKKGIARWQRDIAGWKNGIAR
jgi:hypothetical protein